MKTIQVRRTRHAGYCWRSKDKLISDILLWTPARGQAGRPAKTYIQQLCADTWCSFEDLPRAMDDIDGWRERVSEIRAGGGTWWWSEIFQPCLYLFSIQNSNILKKHKWARNALYVVITGSPFVKTRSNSKRIVYGAVRYVSESSTREGCDSRPFFRGI